MSDNGRRTGPRCIAIVGPFASGKTSTSRSDPRPHRLGGEAGRGRERHVGRRFLPRGARSLDERRAEYRRNQIHGRKLYFSRLPRLGRVQLTRASRSLAGVDAAIVVAEPDEKKIPALQVVLRGLEERRIPHFLFLNKIDKASIGVRDALAHAAAGFRGPAGAAPDPDLEGRDRHRLHRSRARPRLHLPRACAERGDRARCRRGRAPRRGALHHAGAPRRP